MSAPWPISPPTTTEYGYVPPIGSLTRWPDIGWTVEITALTPIFYDEAGVIDRNGAYRAVMATRRALNTTDRAFRNCRNATVILSCLLGASLGVNLYDWITP